MCYMVSDTPLDPDSWEYRGEYVPNEGNFGMGWGNNHTHLQKFEDNYYLFYHSVLLEQSMSTGASGFRSIGVDKATVNESTQTINKMTLTKTGVSPIRSMNPYVKQQAETMATSGGVNYEDFTNISNVPNINTLGNDASENMQVKMRPGSWTMVRSVDFGANGAGKLSLLAKGTGRIEIRLGRNNSASSAVVDLSASSMTETTVDVDPSVFKGVKNVYFVCTSGDDVKFDAWQFTESDPDAINPLPVSETATRQEFFGPDARLLPAQPAHGLVIEKITDAQGTKQVRKRFVHNSEK